MVFVWSDYIYIIFTKAFAQNSIKLLNMDEYLNTAGLSYNWKTALDSF